MTLTLPIKAGKQYVRRDGIIVTTRQRGGFASIQETYMASENGQDWYCICRKTGKGNIMNLFADDNRDLVADYSPEGEHPYAEILRAIADVWRYQSLSITLQEIAKARYSPEYYRIKPEVVSINGVEVPEPCRKPLHYGVNYWYVNLDEFGLVKEETWTISHLDHLRLGIGIVHLTKEAASLHAEALLSFTKVG